MADPFKDFIAGLLQRGGVSRHSIDELLDASVMELYQQAFTHKSVDTVNNYEYYELCGDVVFNHCALKYIVKTFPRDRIAKHNEPKKGESQVNYVEIYTKIKHFVVSTKMLSDIGMKLGFLEFIRATPESLHSERNKIVEDCMESFFGVTELVMDTRFGEGHTGIGMAVLYKFLSEQLDEFDIPFRRSELTDPKTRLIQEIYQKQNPKWTFWSEQIESVDRGDGITAVRWGLIVPPHFENIARIIYTSDGGRTWNDMDRRDINYRYYSVGEASSKKVAEQKIAKFAYDYMSAVIEVNNQFQGYNMGVPLYSVTPTGDGWAATLSNRTLFVATGRDSTMHGAIYKAAIQGISAFNNGYRSSLLPSEIQLPDTRHIVQPNPPRTVKFKRGVQKQPSGGHRHVGPTGLPTRK